MPHRQTEACPTDRQKHAPQTDREACPTDRQRSMPHRQMLREEEQASRRQKQRSGTEENRLDDRLYDRLDDRLYDRLDDRLYDRLDDRLYDRRVASRRETLWKASSRSTRDRQPARQHLWRGVQISSP
ncbi:hypothetical protein ACOMHN_010807 [Nucella lapillus]